jgi:tRNA A37 threonylcarbamoyladenosine dehydratase
MNRFNRTEQLIGKKGLQKLSQARVAVFGLGAVGSYAVEALARAGIGHLRLVDFDVVNMSNINRQLYALTSTVGKPKAELAAERVRDINPDCVVDARQAFFTTDTVDDLLAGPLDAVVDAIDSVGPKILLIAEAVKRGYFVVSSMGAASRLDANAITTVDISETWNCPLARFVRKRLRRHGIASGVRCVYTPEPAQNKLPPVESEPELAPQVKGRRKKVIGSMSYVTGIFGLKATGVVVGYLLGDTPLKAAPRT